MKAKYLIPITLTISILCLCCSIIAIFAGYFLFNSDFGSVKDASLNDDRKVFIRFKNDTDNDIDRLYLGSMYPKEDSYVATSYQTYYFGIGSGKVSDYRLVSNIPKGYDSMEISLSGREGSMNVFLDDVLPGGFPSEYTSEVKWLNPYTKVKMSGDGLVSGYYTITLSHFRESESNWGGIVDVSISKDK